MVARDLVTLGYKRVSDYADGKQDWVAAGLPIERGVPGEAQGEPEGGSASSS